MIFIIILVKLLVKDKGRELPPINGIDSRSLYKLELKEGVIKAERLETPSPLRDATREILSYAGLKALESANRRWREILAYTRGEAITVTARSVQNWMAAFRRAEAESGCGYLGLLDRVAERGNRNTRIPEDSKQLLEVYFKNHYAVPQAKRAVAVYRLYREECKTQGIAPISERSFYRERARFTSQEVTTMLTRLYKFMDDPSASSRVCGICHGVAHFPGRGAA